MVIETKRLRLRPFEIHDAKWYFEATRGNEVRKYLPGAYCNSLEQAVSKIRYDYSKGDFVHNFYFVIESKKDDIPIGFLSIAQNFQNELEVAMFVSKEQRGKGYVVEALKGFADYIPKGKIFKFAIDKKNRASLTAVQKLENLIEIPSSDFEERDFIWKI